MYCPNCGKKLDDDALFCDECGTKIERQKPTVEPTPKVQETPVVEEEPVKEVIRTEPVEKNQPEQRKANPKEGRLHKCPNCGELISFDDVKCPSCGYEIRDREVNASVQSLFDKVLATDDLDKKIELIKTFPIPNTREDILEFMLLAKSNFDAKYYATNKNVDSVSSAWLSKIDQCYAKAKILLRDKRDLDTVEEIYSGIHKETKNMQRNKLLMIIGGFVAIIVSVICIVTFNVEGNTGLSFLFIALLAAGIVLLVFGFKKKKTNKQLEEERAAKAEKKNRR
jgi:ribosomal protein L32